MPQNVPKRRWITLIILGTLLVLTVFVPTLEWGWQAIRRSRTVRMGGIQAEIPRSWMVREGESSLEAWKPCLTSFCMSRSASVSLLWLGHAGCAQDIVMRSSRGALAKLGKADPQSSEVRVGEVTLECLAAAGADRSGKRAYSCYNWRSCILGSYYGSSVHLESFYSIEASARYDAQ